MALKLFQPYVNWRAKWNVLKVLGSGQLAEGLQVKQLEHDFSKKFNLRNVVAVNSGTSALELAYELAGIGRGDEVISTILTCTATHIPLVRRGAKIVFADIENDLNISIHDVEKKITKKTKAVVFVHFGGNSRGLAELSRLCKTHSLTLIEDAAQAIGSDYWAKGDFTCVSLQAIKTLTSGDGGFLITKRAKDYRTARRLRWFGYDREEKQKKGDTDLTEAGYKYHMNNISAAIGLGNLAVIDTVIRHRNRLRDIYASYGMFAYPWLAGGFTDNYEALKYLYECHGIEIGQHHYRNDKYTIFKKFKSPCPMMDKLDGKYFFVPMHMGVSLRQAHKIGKIYSSL